MIMDVKQCPARQPEAWEQSGVKVSEACEWAESAGWSVEQVFMTNNQESSCKPFHSDTGNPLLHKKKKKTKGMETMTRIYNTF